MKTPIVKTLSLVPGLLAAAVALAAQQAAPEIESIRQADMKADLTFLASDGMAGRLTDTHQNALAAGWVASRFERLGLKPVGDNGSYFHGYHLVTTALGTGNRSSLGQLGTDWYPARFSPTASASGELAFAGYGISSPERRYDDYTDAVKGKIVIVLDHEPGENDPASIFDGVVTSQASSQMMKAMAAQARGATGILFVSDVHNHPTADATPAELRGFWGNQQRAPRLPSYLLGAWLEKITIPAVQVSPATVERLLAGSKTGRTLIQLSKASDTNTGSKPVPLAGTSVEITTSVQRTMVPDRNVVGLVEGSDPELRDEIVIVCAHYDHDGVNGENVLNGADDDGSGIVGVMEIAEAYARLELRGTRSARSLGLHRTSALPSGEDRRRPQHGHDRPKRRGAREWRRPIPRARSADRRVQCERGEHHRHNSKSAAEGGRRAGERRYRPDPPDDRKD